MADKDPLKPLKDLTKLKSQLEEIQQRVEREISVGVPQGSSFFGSPFLKGFLAGYLVARLRSSAIAGLVVGAASGVYAAQNYDVPNIEKILRDYMSNMKKGPR